MLTAIWICLCLFASLGVVQAVGWLICRAKRPKGVRRGYRLIPLYDGPEETEVQLRYCLSQIHWGGCSGEIILVVDMGLGEESLTILGEMMKRHALLYCKIGQLQDTIRQLDDLQTA